MAPAVTVRGCRTEQDVLHLELGRADEEVAPVPVRTPTYSTVWAVQASSLMAPVSCAAVGAAGGVHVVGGPPERLPMWPRPPAVRLIFGAEGGAQGAEQATMTP